MLRKTAILLLRLSAGKKFATTTEVMLANWVQRFIKRGSFPQKVGSKPQRCERIYKRTAKAQRDFLRGSGDRLHCVPATPGEIVWEFKNSHFASQKPQFFCEGSARQNRKLSPCLYPQKVGSKPQRCERVYKRTAKAQRDFLRGSGDRLHCVPATPRRNCLEFKELPFCFAKPQFSC